MDRMGGNGAERKPGCRALGREGHWNLMLGATGGASPTQRRMVGGTRWSL